MNEQFTKTLDALEAAENEMIELHNILDGLEIRNRASWHETQSVAGYREKLKSMQASIRAMLGKREEELLRGLRAEQSFAADAPMWRCKACGSENSHQFANCVHCGASGRR